MSASTMETQFYEVTTAVDEEIGLMTDQAEMAVLMQEGDFDAAQSIYTKGAHSKLVAELTLETETTKDIPQFTVVQGTSIKGEDILGKTTIHYPIGSKSIRVEYDHTNTNECRTGGKAGPTLDGCFMEANEIIINEETLKYTYDPSTDNGSDRTLEGLSTHADRRFRMSQGAPIVEHLQPFAQYYGHPDYGDRLVRQALNNINPNKTPNDAVKSIVATMVDLLTSYFHLSHFMIRDMEMANYQCLEQNEDLAIHALDRAYTLHFGGSGARWMLLADKLCSSFKTCNGKHGTSGASVINDHVRESFIAMKEAIPKYNCATVRHHKDMIVSKMKATIFQGMIASTHEATTVPRSTLDQRTTDMFSRVATPWISKCHHTDIDSFHNFNGITGANSSMLDLDAAVAIMEKSYSCMGIQCADVGGLWNAKSKKYIHEPCLDASTAPVEVPPKNHHIKAILGTSILLVAAYFGYKRYKKVQAFKARKERRRAADPNFYDSDDDSDSSYEEGRFT